MLVGRTGALERLDALAASARTGRGGRLVVIGEPGMGRSALLDAAHRRAARRGLAVVHLRVGGRQDTLPHSLLEDLERRVRSVRGTAPDRSGDWDRAALDLLDWLVADGPAVLLVDDADCADPASLATLRTALHRMGAAPLAAAVATRPVPVIVAQFPEWDRLRLGPLQPDAAAAILRSALGPGRLALDPIVDALHGNPMALARAPEVLTQAQLSGQALLPDPMPVPDALATSWSLVLDQLTPTARASLVDLAVAGPHLDVLAGMADSGMPAALDELVAAALVTLDPTGAPVLGPATLREVVLTRSPADQVRRAHARAGRAGQALGRPPGEIVAHLRRSVIVGDTSTAAAIAAQASRAEAAGHLEPAAQAWATAARMTTDAAERVHFALSAVRLAYWLGLGLDEGRPALPHGDPARAG